MLERNKKTLIPFVMAGYPSLASSEKLIRALAGAGCNVIEVGVPFSDPLADGPAIQLASEVAVRAGVDLPKVFAMCSRVRAEFPDIKLVLFTYLNPIYKFGFSNYVRDAVNAGVTASLVVDLPVEEAYEYLTAAREGHLKTVFLISPSTSVQRMKVIADATTGFIYYVSRTGVTGESRELSSTLTEELQRLSHITDKPVAVGFGISTATQAAEAARSAQAAVVGSRYINILREIPDFASACNKAVEFTHECLAALK